MKKYVVLAMIAGTMLVPGTAEARPDSRCACLTWAGQFAGRPSMQRLFDRQVMFHMSQAQARRVKRDVYDYAKRGDFKDPFCKRHAKACKAAIACVIAGGATYSSSRAAGQSREASTRAGTIACAGAAATVMATS